MSIHLSDELKDTENGSSTSIKLSSVRIPIYGTQGQPTRKIIPIENRLTYSWKELNAFTCTSSKLQYNHIFRKERNFSLVTRQKQILQNVCGVAYPGELLAILGSSGAGKSTLLNALTFQTSSNLTVTGIRYINGKPATSKHVISQSAYVQQDDLFIGNLTVREHLIFQSLVRMERNVSYGKRLERVEEVIAELGLTKCQDTQIGIIGRIKGISGGEKKRLSFASELLTNPLLMFCDEPTSGLDSFMALNVIQVLKSLTISGKTVICTIHQPSSELYAMFDKLLLMSEGRTAFLGSPEEADFFFKELEAPCPKNYNPADYFIQLLAIVPDEEQSSRQAVNLICEKFERSTIGVKVALEAGGPNIDCGLEDLWFTGDFFRSSYRVSWWAQFRAVLWRSWITVMKEPMLIKVRLIQTIIISLIIGIIYYGQVLNKEGVMNINGALFIFITNMTFQNVFAVVNVFCAELQIFFREHRAGLYGTDIYFLSKILAEAPIFIIIPIVAPAVSYYMIGLNPQISRFLIACGILVLVGNVAISFGYMISCVSPTISVALSLGPSLIIPFLLFGGFFLNISSIPFYLNWLSYLSWFRYGNEALMINQWHNVTNINCTSSDLTCPRTGQIVLETYNFNEDNFTINLIMLGVLIVGFRLLAYTALLIRSYRRK